MTHGYMFLVTDDRRYYWCLCGKWYHSQPLPEMAKESHVAARWLTEFENHIEEVVT